MNLSYGWDSEWSGYWEHILVLVSHFLNFIYVPTRQNLEALFAARESTSVNFFFFLLWLFGAACGILVP